MTEEGQQTYGKLMLVMPSDRRIQWNDNKWTVGERQLMTILQKTRWGSKDPNT